ncbi:MAG: AlpA family phage regulatory protein [Deltaproteobacteria bacterium]|nr:AlpA family phage regulatory protein [Deltaproteobacteria bacterium]
MIEKTAEKIISGRLLRLPQVLERYPVSRSTFLAGVKSGRYPKPVRLSARCVGWPEWKINKLIEGIEQ